MRHLSLQPSHALYGVHEPCLVSLLLDWAEDQYPLKRSFTFWTYPAGQSEPTVLRRDFGTLARESMALAKRIAAVTMPGDRVLVMVEPGLLFHRAFFACLLAGVIPVPLPEPTMPGQIARMRGVAADCKASLALLGGSQAQASEKLAGAAGIGVLQAETAEDSTTYFVRARPSRFSHALYLQYTSGSTGDPKGVIVSDANLAANIEVFCERWHLGDRDRLVSWLPPYHDMGLIAGVIAPVWRGADALIMRTTDFSARPQRWLAAIEAFRATISIASNFAYDLCAGRTTASAERPFDLSSLKKLVTGAEPVRAKTIQRFVERFASCGVTARHFCPAYGLAEATLMVSGRDAHGEAAVVLRLDREAFARGVARETEDADGVTLVSCGAPAGGMRLRITDPDTALEVPAGHIGEIWVAGDSVCSGYWNIPSSRHLVRRRETDGRERTWLRTGDLGFLHQGELFVTGRLKDLLIVNGANLDPADLEEAIENCHGELRSGGCAVFAEEASGRERMVVLQELARAMPSSGSEICRTILDTMRRSFAVIPDEIALVRKRSLVRTTSGKVSRSGCRTAYAENRMETVYRWARGAP
jgi:acyl-CoA synthetase (AMP-forming)/AMP-acid ligase II